MSKRSLSPGLPYDDDSHAQASSSSARRDKPKDWRDAFLDDDERPREREPRRDDRDRDRRERGHGGKHDRRERDIRGPPPRLPHHKSAPTPRPHGPPFRASHQSQPRHYPHSDSQSQSQHQQHQNHQSSAPLVPTDVSKPPPSPAAAPPPVEPEPEPEPEPELSAEEIIELRRRKRQEILDKYRGVQSGAASAATSAGGIASAGVGAESGGESVRGTLLASGATPILKTLTTTAPVSAMPAAQTPAMDAAFDLEKSADDAPAPVPAAATVSAADYDSEIEQRGDGEKKPIIVDAPEALGDASEEEIEVEEEEDEFDMFALADEDRPKKVVKKKVKKAHPVSKPKAAVVEAIPLAATLVDNYDDSEGYYRITPGETLDGKYQVTTTLGKGMFSAVVRAKVIEPSAGERKEVAIKIIRSQESMYIAGRKEAAILEKLMAADPDDKKHIVRMHGTFEHRGHLCIVTESLSMNLRDVVKRYGKDVGLNLRAVRAYAHQMFLALSLMKKCSLVHADIKPDNILVTDNKATLKVCDLGSACDAESGELTPYLVSRFYRAPEIILGLPFDAAIDVWSVGCTLYELFTGKILLPGRSNNQMLKLMMDLKGKFNHKMIKKAAFGTTHFDEGMNFISVEKDKITGADTIKTLVLAKPTKDLRAKLIPASSVQAKMKDDELKLLLDFVDLVDKCLVLDPAKRITPRDALVHPFITA